MEVKDFPISATLVSFLPYELNSSNNSKPGLIPPYVYVPAADRDDFVVAPVPDHMNWVYLLDGKQISRMISGIEVASAIAYDHISASYGVTPDAFPGIKSIPGNHTKDQIKKLFPEELKALLETQKRWFGELVKRADDIWNDPAAKGKHRSISDLQRYAAKYLGLNREWLTAVQTNLVACFACGWNIPDTALVCQNCKTIVKPEEYKKQTLPVEELKEAQIK